MEIVSRVRIVLQLISIVLFVYQSTLALIKYCKSPTVEQVSQEDFKLEEHKPRKVKNIIQNFKLDTPQSFGVLFLQIFYMIFIDRGIF